MNIRVTFLNDDCRQWSDTARKLRVAHGMVFVECPVKTEAWPLERVKRIETWSGGEVEGDAPKARDVVRGALLVGHSPDLSRFSTDELAMALIGAERELFAALKAMDAATARAEAAERECRRSSG